MTHATLRAPFPYFGGKSRPADSIWSRLGDVDHYIEPFAGSLAVLLARPHAPRMETANDKDAYICNFWRAAAADPDLVARHADHPVNETDLLARHVWLRKREGILRHTLEQYPGYYSPKIAGWWVWGISQWIGNGWCSGPLWHRRPDINCRGRGIHKKRPELQRRGRGIHNTQIRDRGIRQTVRDLAERLRYVRVCCGDWKRVVTGGVITKGRYTYGILLDPPYGDKSRQADLYAHDSYETAGECRAWALEFGARKNVRIALCGLEGEHNDLKQHGWTKTAWATNGGYGNFHNATRPNEKRKLERIWFSPQCAAAEQPDLFDGQEKGRNNDR